MNALARVNRIKAAETRHYSKCGSCRNRTAQSASGLCITGFRFFLSYMGAIDRLIKSVVFVD